jgi:glycerol kinase
LDNVHDAREKAEKGDLLFGTTDCWLLWKLTDGKVHATDETNASRTMLYDIHRSQWSDELLSLFTIPKSIMPEVKISSADFGKIETQSKAKGIPIAGIAGDQQSSLFGNRCFKKGEPKTTFGTGCFTLLHTGETAIHSENRLLTTIAARTAEEKSVQYALEGSVFIAGALIQWLRDELGIIKTAESTTTMAKAVEDNGGVYIVPAFTGLGAPYWESSAKGIIAGLTRGTTKAHIVRAALEAIAYQNYDLIKTMQKDVPFNLTSLKADGGATANDFLMQFQANILETEISRNQSPEITALGAAFLAGLQTGFWESKEEINAIELQTDSFYPNKEDVLKNSYLLAGWEKAVGSILQS